MMHTTTLNGLAFFSIALFISAPTRAQDFDLDAAIRAGTPLSADEAAVRAVENAPSLARARALSEGAEASVARARAAMLPQLQLTARYAHVDGFPDGEIGVGVDPESLQAARALAATLTDPSARLLWESSLAQQADSSFSIAVPRDQLSFSARLTWPVSDLFFAMMPALEGARHAERASEYAIDAERAQIDLQARRAFYSLARARGQLAVAREAERQARGVQEQIDAAHTAGFLTEADALAAASRVAQSRGAVQSAEAAVALADSVLRVLLQEGEGETFAIGESLTPEALPHPPGLDEALRGAREHRPELLALRARLSAQQSAAQASDARGYPHLALYAGADLASPNRYIIPPNTDLQPSWELGILFSWIPNEALDALHRGQQMNAEQRAIEAQIQQLERGVELEVRQAHTQIRLAGAALDVARAAERAAERAYESRNAQVAAGGATTAELFTAEAELNRARLAMLDAAIRLRTAEAEFRTATAAP